MNNKKYWEQNIFSTRKGGRSPPSPPLWIRHCTTKLVCWPPVTPMVAIGCTPGLSQHAGCAWMMRRCVWPLGCASELTSAKNMTAPVVSKFTEGAPMGCRTVEVLAGYPDYENRGQDFNRNNVATNATSYKNIQNVCGSMYVCICMYSTFI